MKLAFTNSKTLNKITSSLLENCFSFFTLKNYKKNETILQAGHDKSSKIIIVIEGSIYDVILK